MKLLLATHNEHKRREFSRLLPGHEVISLPAGFELPPEDGDTFEQNALGKARAAASLALAAGGLAIADDSGIEAQALAGAPGVRSARYAGEQASDGQNLRKLIEQAPPGSELRYVCALALVDPQAREERVFVECCKGRMAARPRGERGFGYDPVFVPDEQPWDEQPRDEQPRGASAREGDQLTMAELTDAQKDEISHRGRAVRALGAWLRDAPTRARRG
jgi:XTP/dITP diphosphohydrolase